LKEGKVYAPEQAQRALRHYFAPGNLSALRELAMRRAADQIDEQVREHRQAQGETAPWAAADRILVCIDDREEAQEVVRHAKRLADRAKSQWIAAYVLTARHTRLSEAEQARVAATMRLAASLGAETASLPGDRVADTLIAYAREQNVTHIVVGKAKRPRLFEAFFGSVVRDLIDEAESIAIYIVPEEATGAARRPLGRMWIAPALSARDGLQSFAFTSIATLAAYPLDALVGVSNLTLVYLPAVLASALTRGVSAGLLTGFLSALAYNYFFTEPKLTFTVANPENLLSIFAFSGAAIVVSTLASRARRETLAARAEAQATRDMFDLTRRLAGVAGEDDVGAALASHIARVFGADCVVFARVGLGDLRVAGASPEDARLDDSDLAAARWAMEKGEPTGQGANTLPGARWLSAPMKTARLFAGVVSLRREKPLTPMERRRLDAVADQGAAALERAHIARAFEETRIDAEAERLRATMLSSLSHDLKTPIAGILGSASSLRAYGDRIEGGARQELLANIEAEADRIQRYVIKLLDMTRLDSGAVKTKSEALEVADVISALMRRAAPLVVEGVSLAAETAPGLPLLKADGALLEQALFNLVENAILHGRRAGEDRSVTIRARHCEGGLAFDVLDDGPGLSADEANAVFGKFYRGENASAGGAGLGLAIVKGFSDAMGARVTAANRADRRGAVFTIAFPAAASITESP
jgi:two-component system sensor histidine kinase KdpD